MHEEKRQSRCQSFVQIPASALQDLAAAWKPIRELRDQQVKEAQDRQQGKNGRSQPEGQQRTMQVPVSALQELSATCRRIVELIDKQVGETEEQAKNGNNKMKR